MLGAKILAPCLRVLHLAFQRRPVLADCVVGFGTFSLGEWVAQCYAGKRSHSEMDYGMVVKTGLLGIAVNGLLLRKWYTLLDRVFSPRMDSYAVIAKKIVADQLFIPPAYLAIFFTYTTMVDSKTTWQEKQQEIRVKFEKCFVPAYLADCLVWPVVNITTFRYVPLTYRPAYIGMAELLWQTYLSHMQTGPKHDAHISEAAVQPVQAHAT